MTTPRYRPEELPTRMRSLPIDKRGLPIPWFVMVEDGVADFRVVAKGKVGAAIKRRLCWVCGQPLGRHLSYVIGPMCGITRTISDPPSHLECARWSALHCPFMSDPAAKRSSRPLPEESVPAAGLGLKRNPGVVAVWSTRHFKPFRAPRLGGGDGVLFELGDADGVEWYANGRQATRAEVNESVETGLPALMETAMLQGDPAVAELTRRTQLFMRQLDADPVLRRVDLATGANHGETQ